MIIVRDETAAHRLTEAEVVDLVDLLARAARVPSPAVTFLPWLDDEFTIIQTVSRPGRRRTLRIDIARRALDELSPAGWHHLLAHEIGHVRLHRTWLHAAIEPILSTISALGLLAALAWFMQDPSVVAAGTGIALGAFVILVEYTVHLVGELQADRYAVWLGGVDHATIEELWSHHGNNEITSWVDRYRRLRLHRLVDQFNSTEPSAERTTRRTITRGEA